MGQGVHASRRCVRRGGGGRCIGTPARSALSGALSGFRGVIMLRTARWFAGGGADFCAVYGHRPGLVVEGDTAKGAAWRRFVITADDATLAAVKLAAALAAASS